MVRNSIRVRFDITKPLKRFVRVGVDTDEEEVIILLTYEKLPDFCYRCGIIGHALRDCEDEKVVASNLEYGNWLRASYHLNSGKSKTLPTRNSNIRPDKLTPIQCNNIHGEENMPKATLEAQRRKLTIGDDVVETTKSKVVGGLESSLNGFVMELEKCEGAEDITHHTVVDRSPCPVISINDACKSSSNCTSKDGIDKMTGEDVDLLILRRTSNWKRRAREKSSMTMIDTPEKLPSIGQKREATEGGEDIFKDIGKTVKRQAIDGSIALSRLVNSAVVAVQPRQQL